MICWWSLDLETYSKRALRQGGGGWGQNMPCVQGPHHLTFLQVGRDPARAHLTKGTKLASGSCLRESETLLRKPSSAPLRVCSGKQRFLISPLPIARHRNKEGLGCLLLPVHWCLQVIARAGKQLQTCSTSGRRRMGPEKALCALAPTPHPLPPREGPS